MIALLCALLVRVELLGLVHPHTAWIERPGGEVRAEAEGDLVRLDGGPPRAHVEVARPAHGRLRLRAQGAPPRELEGALELSARAGELLLVASLPLEAYVAGVVEAELGPKAEPAAAEALAVVARSFAVRRLLPATTDPGRPPAAAPGQAHAAGAPLCDQTHCQLFLGAAGRAARRAAEATRGQVLLLASGAVAPALHHAACGGRTASAREVWPAASEEDAEAGTAVEDLLPGSALPACTGRRGETPLRWTATLAEGPLARALGTPVPLAASAAMSSEEAHLRLGRAFGWDTVRSPRFTAEEVPSAEVVPGARLFVLRGSGHGHGVGLCQRGAAALAERGYTATRILDRYFPRLRLGPLPKEADSR